MARLRDLALLPALVVLLIIGSVISPVFLTSGNINTILTSSAALALVVLAESLVIITGKFDLSLESIYGIAPAIGAMVVLPAEGFGFGFEWPTAIGILTVLVVGGLVGFINGFMVVKLRLSAFIVTLGDADHPARHAGWRDARADLVRPPRRLLRPRWSSLSLACRSRCGSRPSPS